MKSKAVWFMSIVVVVACGALAAFFEIRRQACIDDLDCRRRTMNAIVLAMLQYHIDHGRFPISENESSHSWRVALLPYLEREDPERFQGAQGLYRLYETEQRWNSDENDRVRQAGEGYFTCRDSSSCSYFVLTGDASKWPAGIPSSLSHLTGSPGDVVLIVEILESSNVWTEPIDVDTQSFLHSLELSTGLYLGYQPYTILGFADGTVRAVLVGSPEHSKLVSKMRELGAKVP